MLQLAVNSAACDLSAYARPDCSHEARGSLHLKKSYIVIKAPSVNHASSIDVRVELRAREPA